MRNMVEKGVSGGNAARVMEEIRAPGRAASGAPRALVRGEPAVLMNDIRAAAGVTGVKI